MLKVVVVIGTRPEDIRMASVPRRLHEHAEPISHAVAVTEPYREMLDQVFQLFDIEPDFDFSVMTRNQLLSELTAKPFMRLDRET